MSSFDELKQLIEKKATFLRGCRCLAAGLSQGNPAQLLPLVDRVHKLLVSRYTSTDFWQAGRQVFVEAKKADAEQAKFHTYLAEAQQFLEANDDEMEPAERAPADPEHPLNVLLGMTGQQNVTHYDDGSIVEHDVRAAQGAPAAEAPAAEEATTEAQAAAAGQPTREAVQRQILEGIQAVFEGMAAVTRGTEAIERELDLVLSAIHDRMGSNRARPVPPMSQKVLASLPIVSLTPEKLNELGTDTPCAVCTDVLQPGDEVFMLPCKGKHWFHPACVKPWLTKTNTCPVCREELPTDDPHYEAHKEQQAEEAAERAGAANALSHSEFMYI